MAPSSVRVFGGFAPGVSGLGDPAVVLELLDGVIDGCVGRICHGPVDLRRVARFALTLAERVYRTRPIAARFGSRNTRCFPFISTWQPFTVQCCTYRDTWVPVNSMGPNVRSSLCSQSLLGHAPLSLVYVIIIRSELPPLYLRIIDRNSDTTHLPCKIYDCCPHHRGSTVEFS